MVEFVNGSVLSSIRAKSCVTVITLVEYIFSLINLSHYICRKDSIVSCYLQLGHIRMIKVHVPSKIYIRHQVIVQKMLETTTFLLVYCYYYNELL